MWRCAATRRNPAYLSSLVTLGMIALTWSMEQTRASGPTAWLAKEDSWFQSAEAKTIRDHILSYQTRLGGWPKNTDTTKTIFAGDIEELRANFDNGATTDELRFLARHAQATGDAQSKEAFTKGLDYIVRAQYPHGGWPQYFPPGTGYARHITFSDDAMVRLLLFVREVAKKPLYSFVEKQKRDSLQEVFDRGIDCILKCQINVDGIKTAWCAQHDEIDFEPRPARVYELVSLSGSESVGIVKLLMSLETPTPEVISAVDYAVDWLRAVKITGIRVDVVTGPEYPMGRDKIVTADPQAAPIWARFYAIGTNKPIFSDQRGLAFDRLADISHERRVGYAWYTDRPAALLEKDYPAWQRKLGRSINSDSP
ncbi:pectate lyase [bacterium]|nr:pectate lyase [bacterium]